jgi:HEAT repeat protein
MLFIISQQTKHFRYSHIPADILIIRIMKLEKRKPSGREKDEASLSLLEQLREKLHSSDDRSIRRRAAFNLSWMQEDGLDILKEALLSHSPKTTKTAAAYGLRNMHGRMKKKAQEVLQEGLQHPNSSTREVCNQALRLLAERKVKPQQKEQPAKGKLQIQEIPSKRARKKKIRLQKT